MGGGGEEVLGVVEGEGGWRFYVDEEMIPLVI